MNQLKKIIQKAHLASEGSLISSYEVMFVRRVIQRMFTQAKELPRAAC